MSAATCATGPASVVDAVAAGEKAAVGIDRLLTGENHAFWRRAQPIDTHFDPDADPVSYPRAEMVTLPSKSTSRQFSGGGAILVGGGGTA